jgi:hypothetical protein
VADFVLVAHLPQTACVKTVAVADSVIKSDEAGRNALGTLIEPAYARQAR